MDPPQRGSPRPPAAAPARPDLLAAVAAGCRVLLVVVHVESEAQALESADIALRHAGADGIFLIEHEGMGWQALNSIAQAVRRAHPSAWIGINYLDLHADKAFAALPPWIDGLWADNARIDSGAGAGQSRAQAIAAAREASRWQGLYFGGVAFKTQATVPMHRLADTARAAARFMDVITTSGPGTGLAADVKRVAELRTGAGGHPLALASGVKPSNVATFLPLVDIFLVASGIELFFGKLCPDKTKELAQLIHAYRPAGAGASASS